MGTPPITIVAVRSADRPCVITPAGLAAVAQIWHGLHSRQSAATVANKPNQVEHKSAPGCARTAPGFPPDYRGTEESHSARDCWCRLHPLCLVVQKLRNCRSAFCRSSNLCRAGVILALDAIWVLRGCLGQGGTGHSKSTERNQCQKGKAQHRIQIDQSLMTPIGAQTPRGFTSHSCNDWEIRESGRRSDPNAE
jgi:hypothetical protein